jgi:hypothetical protein
MEIFIEAVGILAPGIADWSQARDMLARGTPPESTAAPQPSPGSLPAAERRRASRPVRLALAAAEQALSQTPIAATDMAMVFSSAEASGDVTHQLCEVLAGSREVSPTQFHNSVHNAPSGYYSIAMHAKLAASSVCAGPASFGAGLLCATTDALANRQPVLFVCYDSPMPPPLVDVMPVTAPTAIALVCTPERTPRSLAAWRLAVAPTAGGHPWHPLVPPEWHANASARGLAALATLTGLPADPLALPLSAELDLRIAPC